MILSPFSAVLKFYPVVWTRIFDFFAISSGVSMILHDNDHARIKNIE